MARSNHKTCAALACVAALILLSAAGRPAFAAEASPDRSLPADQAAKLGPELAALYEKRGDFEKAEAAFRALLDLEPSNIYFITKYAEMLARHDRPKALEALKEIPREDSVEANLDYVAALHRLGFADESIAAADDAAMKFRDYRFPYMLAGFARDAGDRDGAMKYYIDALEIASHEPEVRLLVAECGGLILEAADFDREFADLQDKAARETEDANFKAAVYRNLLIAHIAAEKGKTADAEAACQAVWDNRDRAEIIFDDLPALLGGMLERAGAWEKAAEIYKAAIDSGEQKPEYYMALGRAYLKEHTPDPDLALATWRELVKDEKGMNPVNHFLLVETLLANKMTDEADKASMEAVSQFPAAIELVIQRLKILTGGDRDPDAAAKLIADALKQVDPAHQAEAAYAIVMALPPDADAQKLIERALAENDKIEQALVEALLKQAEALAAENKKDEAIALCNKVLALAADEASAAKAREIIKRLETGNTQEAGGND